MCRPTGAGSYIPTSPPDSTFALSRRGERVQRIAEVGVEPVWCRQCDEIVYRSGNRWSSSRVRIGSDVEWEPPQAVLQTEFVDSPGKSWALSADGQRILVLQSTAPSSQTKLHVISGWLRPNG